MRISYVRWNLLCVMFASVRDADLKMSQFAMWSNVLTFESTPRCVYKHDGSDTPKMTAVCVHYSFVLVCTVSIFVHTRHICCFLLYWCIHHVAVSLCLSYTALTSLIHIYLIYQPSTLSNVFSLVPFYFPIYWYKFSSYREDTTNWIKWSCISQISLHAKPTTET